MNTQERERKRLVLTSVGHRALLLRRADAVTKVAPNTASFVICANDPFFVLKREQTQPFVSSMSTEAIPHEPAWVEHNVCQVCESKFGMSTRKHHWLVGTPSTRVVVCFVMVESVSVCFCM